MTDTPHPGTSGFIVPDADERPGNTKGLPTVADLIRANRARAAGELLHGEPIPMENGGAFTHE